MKKMNYTDIIANISNTINAPVKIEKQKNEFIVYTFYVAIAILTVVQLLFLDKFTYLKELITLPNGQIFNSFTLVLYTGIITLCLSILFLKPHVINNILYVLSYIIIGLFVTNYLLSEFSLNEILVLPTVIICGIYLGFLANSTSFMLLYLFGTKQKINSLLYAFTTVTFYVVVRHFLGQVSQTFVSFIIPTIILVILLFVMSFLGKDYFKKIEMSNEKVPISSIVFFILIFSVYVLNGLAFYVICKNKIAIFENTNVLIFVVGLFAAVITSRILFQLSKLPNTMYILLWLIFSIITFQFLYFVFNITLTIKIIILILMGITLGFGFVANYMILGACLQDKSSYNLIRFCVIFIALALSLTVTIKNMFYKVESFVLTVIAQSLMFLFTCFIVFNLVRLLIGNETKEKVVEKEKDEEVVIIDTKYPNPYELLTNKEVIVFEQLLLGNTLRQIAGELHMKYDTVNFHYKNIYRKLEVNSRIELIVRYGKKVR